MAILEKTVKFSLYICFSLVDMVVKQLIKILCINAHKTDASPKDIKISSTPKAEVTGINAKKVLSRNVRVKYKGETRTFNSVPKNNKIKRDESEESTDRAAPLCDESADMVAPLPVIPRMRRVGSLPLVPSAIEQRTKEDYSYSLSKSNMVRRSTSYPCDPIMRQRIRAKLVARQVANWSTKDINLNKSPPPGTTRQKSSQSSMHSKPDAAQSPSFVILQRKLNSHVASFSNNVDFRNLSFSSNVTSEGQSPQKLYRCQDQTAFSL